METAAQLQTKRIARLTVIGAALLFSTGGTAIKWTTVSGLELAALRSGVAALVLITLASTGILPPGWRRFWRPRALLVGIPYATTLVLFVVANKLTTAANAIFLQSTAPLYVLLLAPLLLAERNRRSDVLLGALVAAGMAMFFVGVQEPAATAPSPALGNLIGALSGISWATALIGLRWLARAEPETGDSEGSSAGAAAIAGNLLAFFVCGAWALPAELPSTPDLLWIGYLGAFQIGAAYVLMVRGIRQLAAIEVSLLLLVEPVASAAFAWAFHSEQPGGWALAGCSLILAATAGRVCWQARADRRTERAPPPA